MCLFKHGVPFDVAWAMIDGGMEAEVIAYIVAIGQTEGGKFDWDTMSWEKP